MIIHCILRILNGLTGTKRGSAVSLECIVKYMSMFTLGYVIKVACIYEYYDIWNTKRYFVLYISWLMYR